MDVETLKHEMEMGRHDLFHTDPLLGVLNTARTWVGAGARLKPCSPKAPTSLVGRKKCSAVCEVLGAVLQPEMS